MQTPESHDIASDIKRAAISDFFSHVNDSGQPIPTGTVYGVKNGRITLALAGGTRPIWVSSFAENGRVEYFNDGTRPIVVEGAVQVLPGDPAFLSATQPGAATNVRPTVREHRLGVFASSRTGNTADISLTMEYQSGQNLGGGGGGAASVGATGPAGANGAAGVDGVDGAAGGASGGTPIGSSEEAPYNTYLAGANIEYERTPWGNSMNSANATSFSVAGGITAKQVDAPGIHGSGSAFQFGITNASAGTVTLEVGGGYFNFFGSIGNANANAAYINNAQLAGTITDLEATYAFLIAIL